MDAALFCLGNLSILVIAICWAFRLADRSYEFYLGVIALFPLGACLAVLLAGTTGHFQAPWVTWPLVAVAGGTVLAAAPRFRNRLMLGFSTPLHSTPRWATVVLITFASFPVLRVLTAGTGYFIDDFGYHSVAIASWIQHGDFRQFMPQFMAYLPLNAELLTGWFALPYRNDTMVVLTGLVWLALAATAAAAIVRRNGGDVSTSLLTAALLVASPPLVWQTRTFAASDLAGAAAAVAAIYFAVPRRDEKHRLDWAIVAGLLAGFAAGKAIFLPASAAICLYPLFTSRPWSERLRSLVVMSAAAAVLGAFWYVRNALTTGNPLFPAEFGPFPGPIHKADQGSLKLVGLIASVPWTAQLWTHMIIGYLDWPVPFGLLAVAGYVRAILAEFTDRASSPSENPGLRRLLLASGGAQFLFHLIAPYSIGGGYVNGVIDVYCRYVVPWFLCGIILAGPLLSPPFRRTWPFLTLAVGGLILIAARSGPMLPIGAAIVLASVLGMRFVSIRTWKILAAGSLVAVWPLLALFAPKIRAATDRNLSRFAASDGHPLGDALQALDALPTGTRITRFAHHPYMNAAIYGRQWQLDPIFTDKNGIPLRPLYEEFRANPALVFFNRDLTPTVSPQQFIANLRSAEITTVFVTKYDLPSWPPQQALLEASGEATIRFQDETSVIWVVH